MAQLCSLNPLRRYTVSVFAGEIHILMEKTYSMLEATTPPTRSACFFLPLVPLSTVNSSLI